MTPAPPPPTIGAAAKDEDVSALALPQRQKVILVMDLVESVRLMAANELAVIDHWRGFVRHATGTVLPRRGGRLVKSLGDGIMAEFDTAREGVAAALDLHRHFEDVNASLPSDQHLYLRAGLNATHVFVDDIDIYGSGVNLAARVASLAGPGETMVTAEVRDGLVEGLDSHTEDMGECHLKHVAHPIRAYRVGAAGPQPILVPESEYTTPLRPTIAVIPFDGTGALPALGDMVADGVISQLSRTAEFRVISRLSSSAVRGRGLALNQVEHMLGARYILSGSFATDGMVVLLTAELASSQTGHVIWSDRMKTTLGDLLDPQSAAIGAISASVHSHVVNAEFRYCRTRPLPTLESYSLLIGAITLMHRMSRADFSRSRTMLEALVARHPRNPTPRAWLAKWHSLAVAQSWTEDPAQEAANSLSMVRAALDLDPDDALALTIKGLIHGYVEKDFGRAQEAYSSALVNNPSEPLAWIGSAALATWRGDAPVAVEAAERALALTPLDPLKYYFDSLACGAMMCAGEYPRAIELAKRSLRLNKGLVSTRRVLAIAQVLNGNVDEARATIADLLKLEPHFSVRFFQERSPLYRSPAGPLYADALIQAGAPLE
jgi:adenylate cyclase